MNRYENIPTKNNTKNQKVTRSILYPSIPRNESDLYIYTTPGDRLDLIAHSYYGDVNRWWLIAQANALGKGTLVIPAGTLLRIPQQYDNIIDEYNSINNLGYGSI